MIRRIVGYSSLLIACALPMLNIAQAQTAETQGQSSNGILSLMDDFMAEPVELTEDQKGLYNDELFNFTEDPVATEEAKRRWLNLLNEIYGPENAITVEKEFGVDTIQELVSAVFGDTGFKVSNYFDVSAIQIITDMAIAQNLEETPTEGELAVRDFVISLINSAAMQEQRGKSNADKQVSQQVTALVTMFRLHTFVIARDAGEPTKELAEDSQTRLIEEWSIDPRFQSITVEGIVISQDYKDVLSGKKTVEEVYPNLDLEKLSEESTAPVTQYAATLLLEVTKPGGLEELLKSSSDKPDDRQANATDDTQTDSTDANPLGMPAETKALNPLAANASAFAGQFRGDGMSLSLEVSNDNAVGTLLFKEQQYPVEGVVDGNSLTGNFKTSGGEFPFEAFAEADQLRFETGGASYTLVEQ